MVLLSHLLTRVIPLYHPYTHVKNNGTEIKGKRTIWYPRKSSPILKPKVDSTRALIFLLHTLGTEVKGQLSVHMWVPP